MAVRGLIGQQLLTTRCTNPVYCQVFRLNSHFHFSVVQGFNQLSPPVQQKRAHFNALPRPAQGLTGGLQADFGFYDRGFSLSLVIQLVPGFQGTDWGGAPTSNCRRGKSEVCAPGM